MSSFRLMRPSPLLCLAGAATLFASACSEDDPNAELRDPGLPRGGNTIVADEDTPITFELAVEGGSEETPPTIQIVTPPANGTLTPTEGPAPLTVTYTPGPEFSGSDQLEFKSVAAIGLLESEPVTRIILVNPVNDAPVAGDDEATVAEEGTVTIDVLANDSDIDDTQLVVTVTSGPQGGVAQVQADGSIVYTGNLDFDGPTDRFVYSIEDGAGAGDTAVVNLTIEPQNDAPVAADPGAENTVEDGFVDIELTGSDPEDEVVALTVTVTSQPSNGALSTTTGPAPLMVRYTPNAEYNGSDSFSFTVTDSEGVASEPRSVAITVHPANDAPDATDDAATTNEDEAVTIDVLANDGDIDSATVVVAATTRPEHGTVTVEADGQLRYVPELNFAGTDQFTYSIRDSAGASGTAEVTVEVTPVNDTPTAIDPGAARVDEDGSLQIRLDALDIEDEGAAITLTVVGLPAQGSVDVESGTAPLIVTYQPAADYFGADSITFEATDSEGASSSQIIIPIDIRSVNDPPVPGPDLITTETVFAAELNLLANDTDIDDSPLTLLDVESPDSGELIFFPDGLVRFTPSHPDDRDHVLTYRVRDPSGGESEGQLEIDVTLGVPVEVLSLTVEPELIDLGDAATLTWTTQAADSCTLSPGPAGEESATVETGDPLPITAVVAPELSTTYTLRCEGPLGPAIADITVAVASDLDNDGIEDGAEILLGYDPLDADTDDDGLLDGEEDLDADGIVDMGETSVLEPDTDNDGLCDGPGGDADGDGRVVGAERCQTGEVLFVRADAEDGGDGLTWDGALPSIQAAIDMATAGAQIWVAGGTYGPPAVSQPVLRLASGVAVYGGFAGTERAFAERPSPPQTTLLDGDFLQDDDPTDEATLTDNSPHVVVAADGALLDGFEVTGGQAIGPSPSGDGAGVLLAEAGVFTAMNLRIHDNHADGVGGGIAVQAGHFHGWNVSVFGNGAPNGAGVAVTENGALVLRESLLFSNTTAGNGGGLWVNGGDVTLGAFVATANVAMNGGAIATMGDATLVVTNAYFELNRALARGGAIHHGADGEFVLTNVTAFENIAAFSGGAVHVASESASARLANMVFWANEATTEMDVSSAGTYTLTHSCTTQTIAGTGNVRLAEDPRDETQRSGPRLDPFGPCVNSGSAAAADHGRTGFRALGLTHWSELGTNAEVTRDVAPVDMGWHAPATSNAITAFEGDAAELSWTIDGDALAAGAGCYIGNSQQSGFIAIDEAARMMGTSAFDLEPKYGEDTPTGAVWTLVCLGDGVPLVAHAGTPGCGNRTVDELEPCDTGGDSADCDADCTLPVCGDDRLNRASGEVCDDGGTDPGDGCRADCLGTEICGDGFLDDAAGEQCDAAGATTALCFGLDNEFGAPPCTASRCGDGITNDTFAGEVCDDGNDGFTDGCRGDCLGIEICGDGILDVAIGEECDDAGETAECNGADAADEGVPCRVSLCGDGYVNAAAGETCETGVDGLLCDGPDAGEQRCTAAACGDGYLNRAAGEECDDGNLTPGDGCSETCELPPVVFVDLGVAPGGDGRSWGSAFNTIAAAMAIVAPPQAVWIKTGRYRPTAPGEPVLVMVDGVEVYGGFAGDEEPGDTPATRDQERPNPPLATVLDGDFFGNDPAPGEMGEGDEYDDNSVHVVIGASNARVDGLIIQGGVARDTGDPDDPNPTEGGGLVARAVSNFTVNDVRIQRCWADAGAGMVVRDSNLITLRSISLQENAATGGTGGGLFAAGASFNMVVSSFTANTAANAAGIACTGGASCNLEDVNFERNAATADGGAMMTSGGTLRVEKSLVTNNSADRGAGVYTAAAGNFTGFDISFFENDAETAGGAVAGDANTSITNSSFRANRAADGGAAWFTAGANATFTNISATANEGEIGVGGAIANDGGVVNVVNSILFGNRAVGGDDEVSGGANVTNTCVGQSIAGAGNTELADDAEPFIVAPSGEIFLNFEDAGSAGCVDAGNDGAAFTAFGGFGVDWTQLTSRADAVVDTGAIDLGRHYDPASTWITTLVADETDLFWAMHGAVRCVVTNTAKPNELILEGDDLPAGSEAHFLFDMAEIFATCVDAGGNEVTAWTALPGCGNRLVELDRDEECDAGGESLTCDLDCTFRSCGDGTRNTTAGEICDDGGNSVLCDADCTPATCGDGFTNTEAGESCDDGANVDGDGCPADCAPQILYVREDGPGGNGLSWRNALSSISEAMALAQSDTHIWVAQGTYRPPTAGEPVFTMKPAVRVFGGFNGTETKISDRPSPVPASILDGDFLNNDHPALASTFDDNSRHVVIGAADAMLDGFVLTGGVSSGVGESGGGLHLNGANNFFGRHLTFLMNTTDVEGAGVAVLNSSNVAFASIASQRNSGSSAFMATNSQIRITNASFADNTPRQVSIDGCVGDELCFIGTNVTMRGTGIGLSLASGAGSLRNFVAWLDGADAEWFGPGFSMDNSCTQDNLVDFGDGNVVVAENPIIEAASGELFLDQESDCVDVGSVEFADDENWGFEARGLLDWAELSTSTVGGFDEEDVDPGRHYDTDQLVVQSFTADESVLTWTSRGVSACNISSDDGRYSFDIDGADLSSGSLEHGLDFGSGAAWTMTCAGASAPAMVASSSPGCGNGVREDDVLPAEDPDDNEECDDVIDTASCNGPDAAIVDFDAGTFIDVRCKISECGDGYLNAAAGEECDDGDDNGSASCGVTCLAPRCGDGNVDAAIGEVCDDGNTVSGDGCRNDCRGLEICGDGFTDPGEQCDSSGQRTATCSPGCLSLRTYYVNDDGFGGDGLSWLGSVRTLQDAVNRFNADPLPAANKQIWVATGEYRPTAQRTPVIDMSPGMAVFGGFNGGETTLAGRPTPLAYTLLDGDFSRNDTGNTGTWGDNSYHVVDMANDSTLDGFTIIRGRAIGGYPNEHGGGVHVWQTQRVHLENLRLQDNHANSQGGGIAMHVASSGTLRNIFARANVANNWGGGLYVWDTNVTVAGFKAIDNRAQVGGGISLHQNQTSELVNIMLVRNTASYGGGIYVDGRGSIQVTNYTVASNTASIRGGGVHSYMSSGSALFRNGVHWSNTSPQWPDFFTSGGTGFTYNCAVRDFGGGTNQSTATKPIILAESGEVFLDPAVAGCIDLGDNSAAARYEALGLPAPSSLTTRIDNSAADSGTIDMGYHHATTEPRITSFAVGENNITWTSVGTLACALYNNLGTVIGISGGDLANGSYAHNSPAGTSYTLDCIGSPSWSEVSGTVLAPPCEPNEGEITIIDPPVNGRVENGDGVFRGRYYDTYEVFLEAGERVRIDMWSPGNAGGTFVDTYLRLRNADCRQVSANDDGGSGLNSRIFYTVPTTGTYYIQATTYGWFRSGNYTLDLINF